MDPLLIKVQPSHLTLKDGSPLIHLPDYQEKLEYRHGLEIPHFLTLRGDTCTAIVPTAMKIQEGDNLETEYHKTMLVTEVIERRKARGAWLNNPYDERPDWVKMRVI